MSRPIWWDRRHERGLRGWLVRRRVRRIKRALERRRRT